MTDRSVFIYEILMKKRIERMKFCANQPTTMSNANLVGLGGFEPPTSPLSGVRSNQLSYGPAPVNRLHSLKRKHGRLRREPAQANNTLESVSYLIDERT